ncbi:site-specific integrase [Pediococcus pentosaceus]|uniref:site-specific integrase n=1 Tax=Pediococcus pentosaceus TaxID=1255 RepID=UPI003982B5DC
MASYEKRGKKYRAVVSYTNLHGIRQKQSKTFERKKDAVKWATNLETKISTGFDPQTGNMYYPDYYRQWVKTFKENDIREASLIKYRTWQHAVDKMFANISVNKLTTAFLQQELDEFGKTHSPEYVKNFAISIRKSLKDAQIDGLIERDIYSRLKAHGNEQKAHNDKNYLDAAEFKTLQNYLYQHIDDPSRDYLRIILVALETGARCGEILALERSDFDFDSKTMSITKSLSNNTRMITKPKNKASVRVVSLSNRVSDVLKQYFDTSNEDMLSPIQYRPQRLANELNKITAYLGITPIRFHGLRHSHVSFLLHNNVDINYISQRVGHASTSVTLKTYAHMLKEKELTQNELALNILDN